jgi:hypothetical protein
MRERSGPGTDIPPPARQTLVRRFPAAIAAGGDGHMCTVAAAIVPIDGRPGRKESFITQKTRTCTVYPSVFEPTDFFFFLTFNESFIQTTQTDPA